MHSHVGELSYATPSVCVLDTTFSGVLIYSTNLCPARHLIPNYFNGLLTHDSASVLFPCNERDPLGHKFFSVILFLKTCLPFPTRILCNISNCLTGLSSLGVWLPSFILYNPSFWILIHWASWYSLFLSCHVLSGLWKVLHGCWFLLLAHSSCLLFLLLVNITCPSYLKSEYISLRSPGVTFRLDWSLFLYAFLAPRSSPVKIFTCF